MYSITAQGNGYVSTDSTAARTPVILVGFPCNLLLQVDTSLGLLVYVLPEVSIGVFVDNFSLNFKILRRWVM